MGRRSLTVAALLVLLFSIAAPASRWLTGATAAASPAMAQGSPTIKWKSPKATFNVGRPGRILIKGSVGPGLKPGSSYAIHLRVDEIKLNRGYPHNLIDDVRVVETSAAGTSITVGSPSEGLLAQAGRVIQDFAFGRDPEGAAFEWKQPKVTAAPTKKKKIRIIGHVNNSAPGALYVVELSIMETTDGEGRRILHEKRAHLFANASNSTTVSLDSSSLDEFAETPIEFNADVDSNLTIDKCLWDFGYPSASTFGNEGPNVWHTYHKSLMDDHEVEQRNVPFTVTVLVLDSDGTFARATLDMSIDFYAEP